MKEVREPTAIEVKEHRLCFYCGRNCINAGTRPMTCDKFKPMPLYKEGKDD